MTTPPAAFAHVRIESLAFELPPHRVTTKSIEDDLASTYKRIGIPLGLIETLVGVVARRFWDDGATVADMATRAAKKALAHCAPEMAGRLGLVMSTSVSKDYLEPSTAALVRGQLALGPSCEAYDVGNACLGFMNAMELAAQQIELGRIDAALVVAAESSRKHVEATVRQLKGESSTRQDFMDALATLTLGSAAVAMVLVRDDIATTEHRVIKSVTLGDSASSTICLGTHEWMKTDSQKLLVNGVDLAARTWALAQEKLGWSKDALAHFVVHQVGATHLATIFKKLDLDLKKAPLSYPELGNIGPAAVPLTLAMAVDDGRVKPGDRVALMGIASGLSCMMMEVVW